MLRTSSTSPRRPTIYIRDPAATIHRRRVGRERETTSDPRLLCPAARPNSQVRSRPRARIPGGASPAPPPIGGRRLLRQVSRWTRACLLRNSNVDAGQGAGCSSGSPHCRRLARISAAVRHADSINRPRSSSDNRWSAASSSLRNAALGFDSTPFSKIDDMQFPQWHIQPRARVRSSQTHQHCSTSDNRWHGKRSLTRRRQGAKEGRGPAHRATRWVQARQ